MPQLQLQLDAQMLSHVRAAAGRDGITINAVVRELLSGWLHSRQQPLAQALREPERAAWPRLSALNTTIGLTRTAALSSELQMVRRPARSAGSMAELLRMAP